MVKQKKELIIFLLNNWDSSSNKNRLILLNNFIKEHSGHSAFEIEEAFFGLESLFFVRIVAWMKFIYTSGKPLKELLNAIQIFINSSYKYLDEFVKVGGVLNLVEILGIKQLTREINESTINLLFHISKQGVQYKEYICECYGIQGICEGLFKIESGSLHEKSRRLLQNLFEGNTKYQHLIYKCHILLLSSSSTNVQHLALTNIKYFQPMDENVNADILEPLFNLLKSLHAEIQFETIEIFKLLINCNMRESILSGLVQLLIINEKQEDQMLETFKDYFAEKIKLPFDVYTQQSNAAKCIRYLVMQEKNVAKDLLKLPTLDNLLTALANVDHINSQRQAAIAIKIMHENVPEVQEYISSKIGLSLFNNIIDNSDNCYTDFSDQDLMILRKN